MLRFILFALTSLLFLGCGGSSFSDSPSASTGQPASSLALERSSPLGDSSSSPLMREGQIAQFRVRNDWKSGFTGEITVTNSTSKTIENWQVSFQMPASINSIWNGKLLPHSGELHRIVAEDYNGSIAPGESVAIGFNGSPGGDQAVVTGLIVEWTEDSDSTEPTEPPSEPGPSAANLNYIVTSDWKSGFGAQVEITNSQETVLEDWVVSFELDADIQNLWNGQILSHQGNVYKIGPVSWNSEIPPGQQASFGFNASPGGSQAQARNFELSFASGPQPEPTTTPTPEPTTTPTPDPPDDPDPDPTPNPPSDGYLTTNGATLVDSSGQTVFLNGINWFGMETETYAPHGLWTRSMDSMLDQMVSMGYTTLRVPYSNEALRPGSQANGIDFSQNPDLVGKSPLQILDILVEKAGDRGMKIVLDRHRPNSRSQSDLWYTSEVSEAQWIADWEMLAGRYQGNPTVIGADLHNEPHGRATWGSGQISTDWNLAAERAGNKILAANPDWLIIVEGVDQVDGDHYWWGGNLQGARNHPVRLTASNKLVYSTHDYATSVHQQSWFSAPNYPSNLQAIWDKNWGYLLKEDIAPVLVGEFGTTYQSNVDRVWLQELVAYMLENGASFTYWSWNPNSGDTGGIVKSDWRTVETEKQNVLESILGR